MRLTPLFLIAVAAFGQSFPTSVFTPPVAADNIATTLISAMGAADTVAVVSSPTGWVANMYAYICDGTQTGTAGKCTGTFEVMKVTAIAGNVLTVARAQSGTSAVAHASGKAISNSVTAIYTNTGMNEIHAIETALGPNLANILSSGPFLAASAYNFGAQSPGGSLVSGNNGVTVPLVPPGMNGTDSGHRVYISGGTGTAEACLITGGSGVAGQTNGALIVNCANSHTGAWTMTSASAGIQEAVQAAQTAGGGRVVAGGGTALVAQGSISITGTGVTLEVIGSGLRLAGGSSIVMSGSYNAVIGESNKIVAASNTGDVIRLVGCLTCRISGLVLDRSVTPAVAGAGINVESGLNTSLSVEGVTISNQYRGVWAQVAPVVSSWVNVSVYLSISQGMRFEATNDEQLTDIKVETSGSHGIQVGNGAATTYCIGGFRLSNAVIFFNGGNGLHIEGAAASNCTYTFLNNIHADTDTGFELYTKYASAISITGSQFINGKGVKLDTGTQVIDMAAIRMHGSSQEGLYITGDAKRITGAAIEIFDAALTGNTAANLKIDGTVNSVNLTGVSIGEPDSVSGYGVLVSGSASNIHINGTTFYAVGNMTTPVSIAAGLTDVFTDVLQSGNWATLTLQNGWTVTNPTQFRLEDNGRVLRLKGTIAPGTLTDGTVVFTLPAASRPLASTQIPIVKLDGSGNPSGTAYLQVLGTGDARIFGAAGATFLQLHAAAVALQ